MIPGKTNYNLTQFEKDVNSIFISTKNDYGYDIKINDLSNKDLDMLESINNPSIEKLDEMLVDNWCFLRQALIAANSPNENLRFLARLLLVANHRLNSKYNWDNVTTVKQINVDTDRLQEELIIEKTNDKNHYKEQYGKKRLPLSQERYYEGQQDMLNKITEINEE